MTFDDNSSSLGPQRQKTSVQKSTKLEIQDHNNEPLSSKLVPNDVPTADKTYTSLQKLELLFSPMYEEYFNKGNKSVSKFSTISDNIQQQDTQPTLNVQPILEPIIPPTDINVEEINTDQADNAPFEANEFINPFAPSRTEAAESSSRNIDTSNMHTFYQRHCSDYHWTKAEPTNIKEAMVDYAWIEAMPDELHQFDRLKVWELVDKPFGKTVINLKWLWKNKKDEDNTVIRNKSRLELKDIVRKRVLILKNLLHQSLA
ncbi:hypothetical protein Tco_0213080 [Tanacetum coccineum]